MFRGDRRQFCGQNIRCGDSNKYLMRVEIGRMARRGGDSQVSIFANRSSLPDGGLRTRLKAIRQEMVTAILTWRPVKRICPSLSLGDIVLVENSNGDARSWREVIFEVQGVGLPKSFSSPIVTTDEVHAKFDNS
jgi:hypothetical protein